jgi:hypothetical protein
VSCCGRRERGSSPRASPPAGGTRTARASSGYAASAIRRRRALLGPLRPELFGKGGAPVGGRGSCPSSRYQPRDKVRVDGRGSYSVQIWQILCKERTLKSSLGTMISCRRGGRVVRQRPAKPRTPVRIRSAPPRFMAPPFALDCRSSRRARGRGRRLSGRDGRCWRGAPSVARRRVAPRHAQCDKPSPAAWLFSRA